MWIFWGGLLYFTWNLHGKSFLRQSTKRISSWSVEPPSRKRCARQIGSFPPTRGQNHLKNVKPPPSKDLVKYTAPKTNSSTLKTGGNERQLDRFRFLDFSIPKSYRRTWKASTKLSTFTLAQLPPKQNHTKSLPEKSRFWSWKSSILQRKIIFTKPLDICVQNVNFQRQEAGPQQETQLRTVEP